MTESNETSDVEKIALIAELRQAGIKHTPEKILRITKLPNGKIVFLEKGNLKAGLRHILKEHRQHFAKRGISEEQIPDVVITAVAKGKVVGSQGKDRPIYEVIFNGRTKYISVTVSNNGFIVGANPATFP
ncbi:MAG: hypothetical protein AB4426_22020 [Xenococcaceae cyanobacterium]